MSRLPHVPRQRLPLTTRLQARTRRLLYGPPASEPYRCMARVPGHCRVIVAPFEGYRRDGLVFCSDEHARLDQEEQPG